MLPRTDLTGTRPLASVEAAQAVASAVDSRQALYSRLAQIGIGKLMMADVLSRLEDGTFLLKIADTAVRVTLPADARVGQQIPLKLVATEPRPTFLLTAATSAPAASASAPASLSSAAQIIGAILQTAQDDGAAAVIIGKTPIVASPLASSPQVAAALRDTLATSGVFYESHLQQWVEGDRSLTQLMREPQAQTPLLKESAAAADAPSAGDAGSSAEAWAPGAKPAKATDPARPELAKLIDIVTVWERDGRTTSAGSTIADAKPGEPAKTPAHAAVGAVPERLDADSAQRINLQLNTLENNRVGWQGELWPGQKLEWEVSEDAPRDGAEASAPSTWTSIVRFELPTLGVISASIHLDGEHVRMQVRTTTDAAAAALRLNGKDLANALDAAGSPLDLLTVKSDDQA